MEEKFVISWDHLGLETILAITEWEREAIMSTLSSKPAPNNPTAGTIQMMMLRARMNPQRHYEIYAVTAVDGITKEDITEMFENTPQEAAETIRRIGVKIFSDRAVTGHIKIT